MCIVCIHNSAVNHGSISTSEEWKISSYNAIISREKTDVEREKVLEWFDSLENFVACHHSNADEIFAEKYKLR